MTSEESQEIWILGEQREGKPKPVTLELMTVARKLADLSKQQLTVAMIGHDLQHLPAALTDYGPDRIIIIDGEETRHFVPEVHADELAALTANRKISAILFPATYDGRDVAARVAAKLGVGLAADCTDLMVDEKGRFVQVRPAFGGNLMAVIHQPSARPQLATLRPGMTRPQETKPKKTPIVEYLKPRTVGRKWNKQILKTVREVAEESGNLDEAEVVIGVGRGLGSKRNLQMVNHLASLLKAAVGGSRGVVDAGWLPHNQQIGLTGRAISPKMYLALGVSGAIQHLVGVRTAKQIVAINTDPEAPIFKVATYGIIGNLFVVVPALIKELEVTKPKV